MHASWESASFIEKPCVQHGTWVRDEQWSRQTAKQMGLREPRTPQQGTRGGTKRCYVPVKGTQHRRGPWLVGNSGYMNVTTEGHDGARDNTVHAAGRDEMPKTGWDKPHLSRGQQGQKRPHPTPPPWYSWEKRRMRIEGIWVSNLKQLNHIIKLLLLPLELEGKVKFHYREIGYIFAHLAYTVWHCNIDKISNLPHKQQIPWT